MNIAERLEFLMKKKGMNRRQLSIASNIPYTTLDGISKKNCDNVKLTTLIKLADFFNVSIDYLIGRGSEQSLSLEDYQELELFKNFLEWRNSYGQT